MKKKHTKKEYESNMEYVKRRANQIDLNFRERVKKFAHNVELNGAKSPFLFGDLMAIENEYSNYHSLLSVTEMIENGHFGI